MVRITAAMLGSAVALYLLALLLLFAAQRRFIYPAPSFPSPLIGTTRFREVRLETSDGLALRALHRPAANGRGTVIFFHGNGDSLAGAIKVTEPLAEAGYGLLLPEYRGYGGNPGSPSEVGLYHDGEAAIGWLSGEGIGPERIVLVGNSLGSGVATELATRHRVAGLALVSGLTSLADVAEQQLRFVPARLLVRDYYDNAAKLPQVAAPVLVLHGSIDTLIPATHGEALTGAARAGHLEIVEGVGHELAYLPVSGRLIVRWLASLPIGDRDPC